MYSALSSKLAALQEHPRPAYSSLLLPKDKFGETDLKKLKLITKACSVGALTLSVCTFIFYLFRLLWCYDHLPIDDLYYGVIASLTCLVGIQGMNIAFAVLYIIGTYKDEPGFLFLWLISNVMLLSLETIVTIYAVVLTDHINWVHDPASKSELAVYLTHVLFSIAPIVFCIVYYRALKDYIRDHRTERQILL